MQQRKTIAVCTLGCKVNQYDSDAVLVQFREAGYEVVDFHEKADVYLINTCTVTNTGDRKSRQMIRRAHRANPKARVVVMGCLAQASPEEIVEIEGVSLVVGTHQRHELLRLVESLPDENHAPLSAVVDDIFTVEDFEELPVSTFEGRTRATLKIQDGCNQFCAYCRVPYARGKPRSRSLASVVDQARAISEQGYQEIVLTGIHLGAYGLDLDPKLHLADAIKALIPIPGLTRIRISSIDPHEITQELLELIANGEKVCAHLHIPLQSGSDTVLERMRRRYTTGEYRQIVEDARRQIPGLAVTTDIIVGFPGETDAEFAETMQFVEEMGYSRLHVFRYSRRSGTPAARFPNQIPASIKEERSRALISLGQQLAASFHQGYVDKELTVLVEEVRAGTAVGLTGNYMRVEFPADSDSLVGKLVQVQGKTADEKGIQGVLV